MYNFVVIILLLSVYDLSTAQTDLKELKSELEYKINKVSEANNAIQKRIEDLTNEMNQIMAENKNLTQKVENIVPVGFIYTQLPQQQEPNKIWPEYKWEDVSKLYEGLFFRVLGASSSPFGTNQNESSPRLSEVRSDSQTNINKRKEKHGETDIPIPQDGKWSEWIWKTDNHGLSGVTEEFYQSYKLSTVEVIPRNTAIKVWKRLN